MCTTLHDEDFVLADGASYNTRRVARDLAFGETRDLRVRYDHRILHEIGYGA
jgi:hypothetical protein